MEDTSKRNDEPNGADEGFGEDARDPIARDGEGESDGAGDRDGDGSDRKSKSESDERAHAADERDDSGAPPAQTEPPG